MDFRVDYLKEAQQCLRLVHKQAPEQPEFWANLLGAIANATMASAPDSVVVALQIENERQDLTRRRINEKLRLKSLPRE